MAGECNGLPENAAHGDDAGHRAGNICATDHHSPAVVPHPPRASVRGMMSLRLGWIACLLPVLAALPGWGADADAGDDAQTTARTVLTQVQHSQAALRTYRRCTVTSSPRLTDVDAQGKALDKSQAITWNTTTTYTWFQRNSTGKPWFRSQEDQEDPATAGTVIARGPKGAWSLNDGVVTANIPSRRVSPDWHSRVLGWAKDHGMAALYELCVISDEGSETPDLFAGSTATPATYAGQPAWTIHQELSAPVMATLRRDPPSSIMIGSADGVPATRTLIIDQALRVRELKVYSSSGAVLQRTSITWSAENQPIDPALFIAPGAAK